MLPIEVLISTEIKNGIKIRRQTSVTLEKSEGMLSAVKAKSGTFPENHISTTLDCILMFYKKYFQYDVFLHFLDISILIIFYQTQLKCQGFDFRFPTLSSIHLDFKSKISTFFMNLPGRRFLVTLHLFLIYHLL